MVNGLDTFKMREFMERYRLIDLDVRALGIQADQAALKARLATCFGLNNL